MARLYGGLFCARISIFLDPYRQMNAGASRFWNTSDGAKNTSGTLFGGLLPFFSQVQNERNTSRRVLVALWWPSLFWA